MPHLSISLLGSWQVLLNGEPVLGFESDKVRALLSYLVLESDRRHRRQALAGMLWPDRPEADAHHCLSQALSNLRHAIGRCDVTQAGPADPPFFQVTRQNIQFDSASDHWLDTTALIAMLDACEQHCHRRVDLCEPCMDRLHQAVDLYRGSLLEGFSLGSSAPFEEWLLLQQERFHRLAIDALRRLCRCHERRGEYERALRCARRHIELEPWQEEAHRHAMRALALTGQRSAALAQYEACRRILKAELGVEPEEKTVQLYRSIHDGRELPSSSYLVRHNLPAPVNAFVGRESELADVKARLRDPTRRLLTLVGPGGIGKTRLALEAAGDLLFSDAEWTDQPLPFPHGIFFVPLVHLQSPDAVLTALAEAVGFSFYREDASTRPSLAAPFPQRQLLDHLRRRRVLLILDGFEHLVQGTALVSEILYGAPWVKVLVTTRARLGVQGEHLYPVPPMQVPDLTSIDSFEGARAREHSAVALFLASAGQVRPDLEPTAGDLWHIVRICRLVQGIPLAILLAAAWVDVLPLDEIAAQVADRSIDFLRADWRDVPERQRSIRAVLDHSWSLLTRRQQEVLERLSIFRGGFTAQAALQVAGTSPQELAGLVRRSLLQRTSASATADIPLVPVDTLGAYARTGSRYEMYELLRQYAAEKLVELQPADQAVHDRHAAYYAAALEKWGIDLRGQRQRAALEEMDGEIGNVHLAWEWAAAQWHVAELARAAEGLSIFCSWRGRYREAESAFRQAAERLSGLVTTGKPVAGTPDPGQVVRVLVELLARQARFEGDDQTHALLGVRCQELLARPELAGQDVRRERARVLCEFARDMSAGEQTQARSLLEGSLALYRELGDRRAEANLLFELARLEWDSVDLEGAGRLWEQSLALFRELGDQHGITACLNWLHAIYGIQGRFDEAERAVDEQMAIAREWDDRSAWARGFGMRASLLWLAGRFAEAVEVQEQEYLPRLQEFGNPVGCAYAVARLSRFKLDNGDNGSARTLAEQSLSLGREMNNRRVIVNSLPVLARQALLEGQDERACRLYEETLALTDQAGLRLARVWCEGEWAVAELHLGHVVQARQHLGAALRLAAGRSAGNEPIYLLPPAALWLAGEGQIEQAVEIYALALRYPHLAHSQWYRDVFGPPLEAAAARLRPEIAQAAQARGQARDLCATTEELLVGLGQ